MKRSLIAAGETRALLGLAIPMTSVALVNMGMSITDTVMMGWISPRALAAGALISDFQSIIFYFFTGILGAMSPLLAHAVGAGRSGEIRPLLCNAFSAAGIIALPAAAGVAVTPLVLVSIGVDGELVGPGRGYAFALALTVVPMVFVTVWRHTFYAFGRPRVYLAALATVLPLNAMADYVLMFGLGPVPAFGLVGAGLASALVAFSLVGFFAWFTVIDPRLKALNLYSKNWHIDRTGLRELFRLGLPIGATSLGEVGIFLLSTVIASFFGPVALAAHAITLRLAGVVYAAVVGLSHATTVAVGYTAGRGDSGQTSSLIRTSLSVGTTAGLLILAVAVIGASSLPWLFLDGADPATGQVAAITAVLIFLLGILNAFQGPAFAAAAALRGLKDTRTPMKHYLTGYWLVGLPVGWVTAFPLDYGVYGIWFGFVAGMAVTAVLVTKQLLRRLDEPVALCNIA